MPRTILLFPTVLLLATAPSITRAASDFAECCLRVPLPEHLRPYQWHACHGTFDPSSFLVNTTSNITLDNLTLSLPLLYPPSILTTLDWCNTNCHSTGILNVVETSQWLTPFTSWVIPAITMLFLCPISERLESRDALIARSWRTLLLDEFIYNWLCPFLEFIQILGDPASAFNGALAQMSTDLFLCMALKRPQNTERERSLIITAILSEQTNVDDKIIRTTFQILAGLDKAREYSKQAGRTMLAARKKFNMSVTLPVAFYIGVAAALFHDATQKWGDNDTSHSLAYGIWLNWILLLSIFSNSFATHLSLEAVRSGLEIILRGLVENYTYDETLSLGWDRSIGPSLPLYETAARALFTLRLPSPRIHGKRIHPDSFDPTHPCHPNIFFPPRHLLFSGTLEVAALPLHRRYTNSLRWSKWLFDKQCDVCRPQRGIWSYCRIWPDHWERPHPARRYLLCQITSWLFVLGSCLCAAFISYTTPRVSVGCRSANHLLFAFFTLITAILRVKIDIPEKHRPSRRKWLKRIYRGLVWFNAVVLLCGGIFMQFTGGFRSCWCAGGVWGGGETVVDIGVGGREKVEMARKVWVMMGLVSYAGVLGCAMAALGVRLYIGYTVRAFLEV